MKFKSLVSDGEVTEGVLYSGKLLDDGDVEIISDKGEDSYLFLGEYEIVYENEQET